MSILKSDAQVLYPNSPLVDYYRLLLLKNPSLNAPITINSSILSYQNDTTEVWDIWKINQEFINNKVTNGIEILNPYTSIDYNSKYANGENDGALWRGKGFNYSLNFGVVGKLGKLEFSFAPVLYYNQNKDYYIPETTSPKNQNSYPFANNLDWVYRYGESSGYNFNLGQSDISLVHKNFSIGVSSQNMIWGPANFNPLLMSNNAAGFPHVHLGTNSPIKTIIGDLELISIWGKLNGSNYYKPNIKPTRYITGISIGYRPKYVEGLSLGINRVTYKELKDAPFKFKDLYQGIIGFGGKSDEMFNGRLVNDTYDQMVSFVLKWSFKEVLFESYLEFARNDFNGSINDFLSEPEHSRAYTLGFTKAIDYANGDLLKVNYEHTNIGSSRSNLIRATPSFYIHSIADAGYTENGQLAGAFIGPGSNSDVLDLSYYRQKGLLGLNIMRIRYNDDYFFSQPSSTFNNHDVEYNVTLNFIRNYNRFQIGSKIRMSRRFNWYYELERNANNIQLSFNFLYKLN